MEVEDARGKPIVKGVHVRYTGTGSAGEVLDFRPDNEVTWVLMGTTDLWYQSESLEVIGEVEYNKIINHSIFKKEENSEDIDEKEKVKEKIAGLKGKFEDVDMSNELCDGGG